MSVHISRGNSKLGKHIHNISLPPVATCPKGSPCATAGCYALKAYRQYPSVRLAWGQNLVEFMLSPKAYTTAIVDHIWRYKPERFRWHVAGDIPNQEYLEAMKMVAILTRATTRHLAFTKQYHLSYLMLPSSLSIMISAWPGHGVIHVPYSRGLSPEPDGYLHTAWCQDGTETRIPTNAYECPGSCVKCDQCWHTLRTRDVWFHKH